MGSGRREARRTLFGGLLWAIAGLVPIVLAPGVVVGAGFDWAAAPAFAILWGGVVLVVLGAASLRGDRRPSPGPRAGRRPAADRGLPIVAVGCVLLAGMLAVTTGDVPGVYQPTTGVVAGTMANCPRPSDLPPAFHPGFPPGAVVELRWEAATAQTATFWFIEDRPNGGTEIDSTQANVTNGALAFRADGGAVWWDAAAQNTSLCPSAAAQYYVSWSYTSAW